MSLSRTLVLPAIALLSLPLFSCGADSSPAGPEDACEAGQTRCADNIFQTCEGSYFENFAICAGEQVCSEALGCAACRPDEGTVCSADAVHSCNADGTIGNRIRNCGDAGCFDGSCNSSSNCQAEGTELVYLVDDSKNFLSFDPTKLVPGGEPFYLIGNLDCPTSSPPLSGGSGPATPFSMSVDRSGTAWVLYSSGELFHVSTQNAACQRSGWQIGQGGFELFGMGFVSNSPGSDDETLFIAGGRALDAAAGSLGAINPTTIEVERIGALPFADFNPELTGTGDAELFGYFPSSDSAFVANLNKSTVQKDQEWQVDSVAGGPTAWAFAHWGGKFYIFVTNGSTPGTNTVYELDPDTGTSRSAIPATPYRVVGAGVSTCAPTQIE